MTTSLDVLHGLRLDDGRSWGSAAADFQVDDATAILAPGDGPRWHFLTRPRGGSKSTDLAGVLLGWLVADAEAGARAYLVAVDLDQAALVIDAAAAFVSRSPVLRGAVRVDALKITSLVNGATVTALPADAKSSFGLKPSFIVVDEVAQWGDDKNAKGVWTAIVSAMGKVRDSRLVCLTSAGSPGHWSAAVIAKARKSKAWRVNEVQGPLPWSDPENLEAQRVLLRPSEYARLHLNEWTASEDSLVDPSDLEQCVTLDGPLPAVIGKQYLIAVDVGIKNDKTIVAVCHGDRIGADLTTGLRVSLDRMNVWAGSRRAPVQLGDVEEWIAEASRIYNRARVVLDPWQAVGLGQRLRARGIKTTEFIFSQQSVGRLAANLAMALRNHTLALPRDEQLLAELLNVRLKESSPGVVRLDHESDGHDDRAVTLAMAITELMTAPAPAKFVFDDNTMSGQDPHLRRLGEFTQRAPDHTDLFWAEDRHEDAGQGRPSPFVKPSDDDDEDPGEHGTGRRSPYVD